ncbi:MAG: sigma-54-dependent Fis family transcriptional regulator, partial [Deltaproteobacteria bacterium]|nr:sigma-54-dependent Fis family transcriptional regulator [Deltaproteobacteria bacterium]
GVLLEEILENIEKEYISQAINMTAGNIAKTARLLNLPRGTLRYKMEKHNLTGS